ncbi:hypothetical protein VTN77DRAFT_5950 [Rasamsonia byssochlamydoides]|uniref:uncharacterized protein n=1 Tax=Rasamsonia byssochlamydoides TaxID=89139 RepID=UPI003742E992
MTLGPITTLPAFPLYTSAIGSVPQSSFGLGMDPTVLERLISAGQIASRTWSLFWGWEGGAAEYQLDGNLVLGGYDAAKTSGTNFTGTLADQLECPSSLLIYLNDITLDFPNGTKTSLLPQPGSAMRTCIKPDIPFLTFNPSVWEKFNSSVGGTYLGPSQGARLFGMSYKADDVFTGNMSFVLASGLTITVPNHQLVMPNVMVNDEGIPVLNDTSTVTFNVYDLGATGGTNTNDMPLLGTTFLSSTYVYVDNDNKAFTIWQANPTTETKLVAVNHNNTSSSGSACQNSVPPPSESASSSVGGPGSGGNSTTSDLNSQHLSSGVIVGIAVAGVVAALIALSTLLFYFCRRRQNREGNTRLCRSTGIIRTRDILENWTRSRRWSICATRTHGSKH